MESLIETAARIKTQKHARAVELLVLYLGDDTSLAALLRHHLPDVHDNEALAEYLVTQIADNFEQRKITFNPEQIQDYVKAIQTTSIFESIIDSTIPNAPFEHRQAVLRITQGEPNQGSANSGEDRRSQYSKFFEDIAAQFSNDTKETFKKSFLKNPNLNAKHSGNEYPNNDNQSLLKLALQTILNQSETINHQQRQIDLLLQEKQQLMQEIQQLKDEAGRQKIQRLKTAIANVQHNQPPAAPEAPYPKSPPAAWPLSGVDRDIRDMGPPTDTKLPTVTNRSPSDRDPGGNPPHDASKAKHTP